jgi:hypothetical protein
MGTFFIGFLVTLSVGVALLGGLVIGFFSGVVWYVSLQVKAAQQERQKINAALPKPHHPLSPSWN